MCDAAIAEVRIQYGPSRRFYALGTTLGGLEQQLIATFMLILMGSGSDSLVVDQSGKRLTEDHDATRLAKRQAVESAIDGDTLCDRCNSVQWAQLTEETPLLRNGKDVATLKISQEKLRLSQCRVCRILSSIKPKIFDTLECKIKAISSRITFAYGDPPTRSDKGLPSRGTDPECTVLCIVPDAEGGGARIARTGWHQGGCLGLTFTARGNPKQGPRCNLPQNIDYDLVKQWISFCRRRHSKRCSPPPMKRLQGLQVIDCRLRSTIEAPTGCRYIALSYVWGHGSQGSSKTSEFAPVIEDGISVTLSLGLRYLWVDRYVCGLLIESISFLLMIEKVYQPGRSEKRSSNCSHGSDLFSSRADASSWCRY